MKILGKGGTNLPAPPPVRSAENAVNSQSDSTGYKKSGCLREAVAQEENCNYKSKSHVSTYFLHVEYQFKERECAKPLYKVGNVSVFIFILKTCTKDSFSNQIIFFYEIQILVSRLLSSLFYKLYSRGDHS